MDAFSMPEHVDFNNLVAVREQGERYIEEVSLPAFDLAELGNSSSAVVALLVAWFRYAHVHGKVARFDNVPTGIMNIIEVTELNEVLPIEMGE